MARKRRSAQNRRISGTRSRSLSSAVEVWLERIRSRLPEGGSTGASILQVSRKLYLVSFRASAYGATFISEVRKENLEDGVREAAQRLLERLAETRPLENGHDSRFVERVRRVFRSAI